MKVYNILMIFKAHVTIVSNGSMMEANDLGLNMDCFDSKSRHVITLISTLDLGNFLSNFLINLSFLFLVQRFVFEY